MLIAGQLAVSLDNAMVYASLERKVAERTQATARGERRLETLSITDPLTGLANRRRLEEVLDAAVAPRAASGGADRRGYGRHRPFQAVQRPLWTSGGRRVPAARRRRPGQHGRDTDLVARYGGEEFAIVMPDTELEAALAVAERMRAAVLELAEPHPYGSAAKGVVTVSVGVASAVPGQHGTADCLVGSADVELYRAKRAGRNRVSGSCDQHVVTVPVPAPPPVGTDIEVPAA